MWRSRSTVCPPNFSLTKPTRATIKSAPLFFLEAPQIGSLRPPQKTDLSRKTKVLPDEKSHGLSTQEESCEEMANFRQFGVKEPRRSGTFFAKKRYTSIVACVNRWFQNQLPAVSPEIRCPSIPRCRRSLDVYLPTRKYILTSMDTFFSIEHPSFVSSSHETFVKEKRCLFWGGYRRISRSSLTAIRRQRARLPHLNRHLCTHNQRTTSKKKQTQSFS